MRTVFDRVDMVGIEDAFSQVYAQVRMHTGEMRHRARLTQDRQGSFSFETCDINFTTDYILAPTGRYTIIDVHSGQWPSNLLEGVERAYGAGAVAIVTTPTEPTVGTVGGVQLRSIRLDPGLLEQVAATTPSRRPTPVRVLDHRPASRAGAAQWRRSLNYVQTVLGDPDIQSPLLVGAAGRLLAANLLAVFPNNTLSDPTIEDRHDAHPDTLRRAIAYVDAHADLNVSPADIAEAAHVTLRAVQLAFRRHLDTTPTAYLRRVRLDRVHHELQEADPARTSLTAVAARWGFNNYSRFAASYRAAYGHPPRITRHERPGSA